MGLVGKGAEIGVLRGDFSREILDRWDGKRLYMVDCWDHQNDNVYVDKNNHSKEDHQINMQIAKHSVEKYGDRYEMIKSYSVDASKLFENDELDFVYIDARHDYQGVLEDLTAWYPKVKHGGIISGDDYIMPENREFVKQFAKFEINEALIDFIKLQEINVQIYLTIDDNVYLSWYFVKP